MRETDSNVKDSNAIPDDALEALTRCLYPAIVAYYESDRGKCEFADWQAHRGIVALSGGEAEPDENIRLAG